MRSCWYGFIILPRAAHTFAWCPELPFHVALQAMPLIIMCLLISNLKCQGLALWISGARTVDAGNPA